MSGVFLENDEVLGPVGNSSGECLIKFQIKGLQSNKGPRSIVDEIDKWIRICSRRDIGWRLLGLATIAESHIYYCCLSENC